MTDSELLDVLTKRYEPTQVPPCRVCGAELTIVSCGGGEPTRYVCSTQSLTKGIDWRHYESSQWEDRRQGGDADVMELVSRYIAKLPNVRSQATDGLAGAVSSAPTPTKVP